MRRLLRWCFSALCLFSLAACLGTAWLWWRSYRTPPGGERHASVYIARQHARYTVRSEHGRLLLFRPPPLTAQALVPKADGPAVEELVARVSDQQLEWEVSKIQAAGRGPSYRPNLSPRPRFGTPADEVATWLSTGPMWDYDPVRWAQVVKARQARVDELSLRLLLALEERDGALVAHALLTKYTAPNPSLAGHVLTVRVPYTSDSGLSPFFVASDRLEVLPGGAFAQDVDGLRVMLRPERPFSPDRHAGHDVEARPCSARADPGQIAAARDRWHRLLDVPVGSVPHWPLVATTAIPPLICFGLILRPAWLRRRRRRLGLCARCGYNLTGNTTGTCSECGEGIERGGPKRGRG